MTTIAATPYLRRICASFMAAGHINIDRIESGRLNWLRNPLGLVSARLARIKTPPENRSMTTKNKAAATPDTKQRMTIFRARLSRPFIAATNRMPSTTITAIRGSLSRVTSVEYAHATLQAANMTNPASRSADTGSGRKCGRPVASRETIADATPTGSMTASDSGM